MAIYFLTFATKHWVMHHMLFLNQSLLIQQMNIVILVLMRRRLIVLHYMRIQFRFLGPRIDWGLEKFPTKFFKRFGPDEFKDYFRLRFEVFEKLDTF